MIELRSTALLYIDNQLSILDQRKLPQVEEWINIHSPDHMGEIIKTLAVRGAPLIGVAAALALAQFACHTPDEVAMMAAARKLQNVRPTAVNLKYCVNEVIQAWRENGREAFIARAIALFLEDKKLCDDMAAASRSLIHPKDRILTICNSGGLATVGIGTALGVIYQASCRDHKNIHVYACETRPLLQGARLTTWELEKNKIPYTLICDNMAASLMSQRKIDKVFVGADRIAKNGDAANKIGTYSLAVLAHYHRLPFYVVAPYTTIDLDTPRGADIIIEQRSAAEVTGAFDRVQWSPAQAPVYNPAFDVTPRELITGYVLNNGFFDRDSFEAAYEKAGAIV